MANLNQLEELIVTFGAGSAQKFATKINVTPQAVSAWRTRGGIPKKAIVRIKSALPSVSLQWLLTGDGEMLENAETPSRPSYHIERSQVENSFNSGNVSIQSGAGDVLHSADEMLPIVPYEITRQPNLDVYEFARNNRLQTNYYPAFPAFPSAGIYYCVRQDAMRPRYIPGDILALAPLKENGTIVNGTPYIIDTYSVGFVFRRIYDRGDFYECRVINEESGYETSFVQKTDVIRLLRILGMVRLEA